jgi:hypothetical protein
MFALGCLAPCGAAAQAVPTADTAIVTGVVIDRTDGAPIADVSVALLDSNVSVKTDAEGKFELTNVAAGRRTLYVSVVGFVLVKRTIDVTPGATLQVTIPLSEGTGTYTETVTVTGERFREQEKSVASQLTLGSADIQNLRNLLTNDPMRAIQILPGVTTGDDFRSEFAVRASPFSRMSFTFDGVPASFLLHTVQRLEDGGSIAMLNGDVLDGITLLNGSYPQRYGNRLGAELDFHMREGSRDRRQLRLGVSGTDASVVAEGPLGGRKNGSWLFSARKSYLELLLKQIDEDNDFGFGFSDLQSKLVYDLSAAHRVELSLVAGRSRLDQESSIDDLNDVQDGRNSAALANAGWRFTISPSLLLTQRLSFAANQFTNRNPAGAELDSGGGRDLAWRADLVDRRWRSFEAEAGAQVLWQQRDSVSRELFSQPAGRERIVDTYDAAVTMVSAYAQGRWMLRPGLTVTPGARIDRSSEWGTTGSPWLLAELQIATGVRIRGGAGLYRQVPGFAESFGLRGTTDLRAERAVHTDVGIEQLLGSDTRWQVTLYNRAERGILRLPGVEVRMVDGTLVPPSVTSRWTNALDGYARGVELLVQRRSTTGLSGWLSYSLGFNRYEDRTTGESFDGDYDNRHAFNAYVLYRFNDRFSVAGKLRAGSNVPATGYWEQRGDQYFVSASRNTLPVPAYARLDVRAARTFNHRSNRITLFVEVMNVLARENVRYIQPGVNFRTGQAFGLFESLIPLVPSAGVLVEF